MLIHKRCGNCYNWINTENPTVVNGREKRVCAVKNKITDAFCPCLYFDVSKAKFEFEALQEVVNGTQNPI